MIISMIRCESYIFAVKDFRKLKMTHDYYLIIVLHVPACAGGFYKDNEEFLNWLGILYSGLTNLFIS